LLAEIMAKPKKAKALYQAFLLRLNHFRVLDPACGSGNFLYLALIALRDIEKRAHLEAQEFGLQAPMNMETGPHNILGLEINEFAAELARVTVWIGDIQWCRRNGYPHDIGESRVRECGFSYGKVVANTDCGQMSGVAEASLLLMR
jgi:type II restriction/modification system DNA methylase subunit YeeA